MNSTKRRNIFFLIDKISQIGAYLSGIFMLLIVFLISLEIFLRTLFKTSTMVSDEFSGYFLVFSVFLGLAYTLKEGKHIKITILTSRIKNRHIAKILGIIVILIALSISIYALYYSVLMVYETYNLDMRADSMMETPLWIPEMGVPIGFFLLSLQLISMLRNL